MKWPWEWWREWNGSAHVQPEIERSSAELLGRLEELCDQLEEAVIKKESENGSENDDG